MQSYTEKTSCRVCSSKNLRQVLDLNDQPLANSYHKGVKQQSFPLVLNLCEDCFHLQLSVVVDPNLMFILSCPIIGIRSSKPPISSIVISP